MRQCGQGAGRASVRARCFRRCTRSAEPLRISSPSTMSDWSMLDREMQSAPPPAPLPYDPYEYAECDPCYREKEPPAPQAPPETPRVPPPQAQPYVPPPTPTLTMLLSMPQRLPMLPPMPAPAPLPYLHTLPKSDNPRVIRNKAEKHRRDKLNQSIAELATIVPPVICSARKIDKTGVLRYTAHYLRAHQYVFDRPAQPAPEFTQTSTQALLGLLNGFLLTTTYKGIIVVISQNVNEYLGYSELELLGRSIYGIVHEEDRKLFRDQLMPKSLKLGQNGELLLPDGQEGRQKVALALAKEKRHFVIRFMKLGQRSEPNKYVTCQVEGSLRMSDRACRGYDRCCQMVRRARARGDNPCSSGNDVVFIGIVRPSTETFINESALESNKMEYRTRHSIDGEIIQCEQRIALVTGYMTSEVSGVNAMNFIHRDEVRWVIIALKEMYNQNQLFGESCYRLMTKNRQFIYMRTRGKLDVDSSSRVTSFVCTNTVVDEKEGKHLIKLMKKRFTLQVNSDDTASIEACDDTNDSQILAVEDPRQLEKVILNLVTNLPSPQSYDGSPHASPIRGASPHRLAIIPPKKERIVSAIEKIYSVIKIIPIQPSNLNEQLSNEATQLSPSHSEQPEIKPFHDAFQSGSEAELNSETAYSPATSSDFEYPSGFGISSTYDEMTPLTFGNGDGMQPDTEFEMLPSPTYSVASNGYEGQHISDPLLAGPSMGGLKRPNRFEDQETNIKKKVIDVANHQNGNNELTSGRESPTLEAFFDDEILNTQIESAIESLEETIDPCFPDLLFQISNDVEDFLGTNEGDLDEK